VQGAAPAALITKNAKPSKVSGRHSVQAQAKTAFQAILGAKASAMKKGVTKDVAVAKKDAPPVKTLLLKAMVKSGGPVSVKDRTDGMAADAAKKNARTEIRKQHVVEGPPPHQQVASANAVLQPADQKKKTAKAPQHHFDGMQQPVSLTASSMPGIKNIPKPDASKAQATEQAAAIPPTSPHKATELSIHVVDARKKHSEQPANDRSADSKAPKMAAVEKNEAAPLVVVKDPPAPESGTREAPRQGPALQMPPAEALQRLREMAGSELTRAAGIILRDGGGEIKLTLKPESLGNVRIRMNLVDNAIEGRIIVDNAAVKHVFEGSLDSLMRALTAEGFQTASLQVSVGGQNADGGRPDRESLPRTRRIEASRAVAGDWNVPGVENLSMGDLLVNLFV
jgi:flagellar hook-length control protein FliK